MALYGTDMTEAGLNKSIPPHCDGQEIVIVQMSGAKRWKVFEPPPLPPGRNPLDRGKGANTLAEVDLQESEVLVDTVLSTV
eukprot:SAG11_NODE_18355_length_493_cov_1.159898_1_plen_80_part_10